MESIQIMSQKNMKSQVEISFFGGTHQLKKTTASYYGKRKHRMHPPASIPIHPYPLSFSSTSFPIVCLVNKIEYFELTWNFSDATSASLNQYFRGAHA